MAAQAEKDKVQPTTEVNKTLALSDSLVAAKVEAFRKILKDTPGNPELDGDYLWDLAKADNASIVIPSKIGNHSLRLATADDVEERCQPNVQGCYLGNRLLAAGDKAKPGQIIIQNGGVDPFIYDFWFTRCGIKIKPGVTTEQVADAMLESTLVHERRHMLEHQTGAKRVEHTAFWAQLNSLFDAGLIEKPDAKNVLRALGEYPPEQYARAYHWAATQYPNEDFTNHLPGRNGFLKFNFSSPYHKSPQNYENRFYSDLKEAYLEDFDRAPGPKNGETILKAYDEADQKIKALRETAKNK